MKRAISLLFRILILFAVMEYFGTKWALLLTGGWILARYKFTTFKSLTLLFLATILFGGLSFFAAPCGLLFDIDSCLDRGGRWDYSFGACMDENLVVGTGRGFNFVSTGFGSQVVNAELGSQGSFSQTLLSGPVGSVFTVLCLVANGLFFVSLIAFFIGLANLGFHPIRALIFKRPNRR